MKTLRIVALHALNLTILFALLGTIPKIAVGVPHPSMTKSEYVLTMEDRLELWDDRVSMLKRVSGMESADISTPQVKTLEDLDLVLRDLRGDLDQLASLTGSWYQKKLQFESKFRDLELGVERVQNEIVAK